MNRGRVSIEDVVGLIQIPTASIDDFRISADPSLRFDSKVESDTIEITIDELTAGESFGLSVLATSTTDLPSKPQVSVRGAGTTAIEAPSRDSDSLSRVLSTLISAMAAAYAGLGAVYFYLRRRRSSPFESSPLDSGRHRDDQNMILAYLCGLHGLLNDVEDYLNRSCETNYWAEADRFAALAVKDPTSEEAEERKNVLKALPEYASISQVSEAIVYYDIARIAIAQGHQEEAKENLQNAHEKAPDLVEIRLKLEPQLAGLLHP